MTSYSERITGLTAHEIARRLQDDARNGYKLPNEGTFTDVKDVITT